MRPVGQRTIPCVICEAAVVLESTTSPHPEAPEMVRLPPGAWAGLAFTGEDSMGDVELLICCSDECVQRLLDE